MTQKQATQDRKIDTQWSTFFTKILPTTMGFEGGVDKNQVGDSGNSNRGVTQKAWDDYSRRKGLDGKRVEDLSYGEAARFAYDDYYKAPKLDLIPGEKVKQVLFDDGYNAGPGTAIKRLQEIVGAKADGGIGPKTIKAVADYIKNNGEEALVSSLLDSRENFFQKLVLDNPAKYEKFLEGWNNRINKLRSTFQQSNSPGRA